MAVLPYTAVVRPGGLVTLDAGTALIGKVGIDQATANANEVVVKSGTVTTLTTVTNPVPTKGAGFSVQADLTVDAGAYSIGDSLATVATFANVVSANGKRGIINSLTLAPNDAMPAIAYNAWFFTAAIAGAPAKNAAFVIAAADSPLFLGCIPITAADYIPSQTSWNCATLRGVGLEFQAGAASTSIVMYLVATAVTAPVATHLYVTCSGEMLD